MTNFKENRFVYANNKKSEQPAPTSEEPSSLAETQAESVDSGQELQKLTEKLNYEKRLALNVLEKVGAVALNSEDFDAVHNILIDALKEADTGNMKEAKRLINEAKKIMDLAGEQNTSYRRRTEKLETATSEGIIDAAGLKRLTPSPPRQFILEYNDPTISGFPKGGLKIDNGDTEIARMFEQGLSPATIEKACLNIFEEWMEGELDKNLKNLQAVYELGDISGEMPQSAQELLKNIADEYNLKEPYFEYLERKLDRLGREIFADLPTVKARAQALIKFKHLGKLAGEKNGGLSYIRETAYWKTPEYDEAIAIIESSAQDLELAGGNKEEHIRNETQKLDEWFFARKDDIEDLLKQGKTLDQAVEILLPHFVNDVIPNEWEDRKSIMEKYKEEEQFLNDAIKTDYPGSTLEKREFKKMILAKLQSQPKENMSIFANDAEAIIASNRKSEKSEMEIRKEFEENHGSVNDERNPQRKEEFRQYLRDELNKNALSEKAKRDEIEKQIAALRYGIKIY